jgi:hypothetical protein
LVRATWPGLGRRRERRRPLRVAERPGWGSPGLGCAGVAWAGWGVEWGEEAAVVPRVRLFAAVGGWKVERVSGGGGWCSSALAPCPRYGLFQRKRPRRRPAGLRLAGPRLGGRGLGWVGVEWGEEVAVVPRGRLFAAVGGWKVEGVPEAGGWCSSPLAPCPRYGLFQRKRPRRGPAGLGLAGPRAEGRIRLRQVWALRDRPDDRVKEFGVSGPHNPSIVGWDGPRGSQEAASSSRVS